MRTRHKADKYSENKGKKYNLGIYIILLLAFIAFYPALNADFINFDDPQYVYENTLIQNFSNPVKFFVTPVQGNIHPLTIISLAINFSVSDFEAWSYHLFNILIHLLNVYLVFRLAMRLSSSNIIISLTTSLLFGLHPMRVESVAWVTERKDVLYSFFFLLGLISYIKSIDLNSKKHFYLCIIWMILSILSKPSAVIFPIVLFTIDFLRKRKFNFKLIIEKIPMFILSAIAGFITLHYQIKGGATSGHDEITFLNNIFYSFYAFMMYIMKCIAPFNLAPFYPLPSGTIPISYYISPLIFIAIVLICLKTFKPGSVITFGFAFFFINLLLVLHIFSFGFTIIADRYTYVPYFGLFYICGYLLDKWKIRIENKIAVLAITGCILLATTITQTSKWKNSATLWDHAIRVSPSYKAYHQRAIVYHTEGDRKSALNYYNESLKLNPEYVETYINRGIIYSDENKFEESLADYNKAVTIQPDNFLIYYNRGNLMGKVNRFEDAIKDFTKSINLNHNYPQSYYGRGLAYSLIADKNKSCSDLQQAIRLGFEPAKNAYSSICN